MVITEELNDSGLIRGFRECGEMRYLDLLVSRHIGKVRGMVYAMVLNDHDADDLTQKVFLRATRSIHRFKENSVFSTWLHRITMNTVYDFLRYRQRHPEAQYDDFDNSTSPGPTPDATLAGEESSEAIHAALASLPPKLRAAITLTAIQGLSPGEAASIENCLSATMYWRIHEARRRLKVELKELLS